MRCTQCGFENPPGMRFCGQCGTGLLGIARASLEAERRQLTVMFCDLVGSTTLSARLDPEDMREVVLSYQEACAAVVRRFEGHIAQYLGDGILVYFGYPMAHEDDGKRAVHAALGILEAVGRVSGRLSDDRGVRLAVRVGIHTGLVVVGEVGGGEKHEQLALGEAPNVAARLQGIAEANSVVISDATHRLIRGCFDCRPLGSRLLSGFSMPIDVYLVLSQGRDVSRLEIAAAAGLTPLVGRESERTVLLERWRQAKGGRAQTVLLSGEAGIGKSRLAQELKDVAAREGNRILECRCSSYFQHSAFYPLIDLLRRECGWERGDTPEQKMHKLEQVMETCEVPPVEAVPLLAALLSLPPSTRYAPLTLSPQRQKRKTLDIVLTWLRAAAKRQPLLFVVEDLHWMDPSTQEFLGLLVEQATTDRLLMILTFRPEFRPAWQGGTMTTFDLARLDMAGVKRIVGRLTGGKTIPAEVLRQLLAKSDGVPLFVEELTKAVLELGFLRERDDRYELAAPLPSVGIPATLQDSLMARLDRLATIKEVAQLAATIGREFTYELIHAVAPFDERTLQNELGRLVEAELVTRQGDPPHATYAFRHALIQEAAYESLLKGKRQQLHQQVALVLDARFPEIVETQPELLAHHYTRAGRNKEAIGYWVKAGQRAVSRSANVEAVAYITRGLDVLESLPEHEERTPKELQLRMALGVPLVITKGYSAPQVAENYNRARELCRQLKETREVFPMLVGLWLFYHVKGELAAALELGEELLHTAKESDNPTFLAQAHMAVGDTLYYSGHNSSAQVHLEDALRHYSAERQESFALRYVHDAGVTSLNFLALTLWALGYPDQALQRHRDGMALATKLGAPSYIAHALFTASQLHRVRGDFHTALERAQQLIALSEERGFALWVAMGEFYQGWALAGLGEYASGSAQMRRGRADFEATGAGLGHSFTFIQLADASLAMGQIEDGLGFLDQAVAVGHRDQYFAAEIHRIRGELLLRQDKKAHQEAEACFHRAIQLARTQAAKSFELRAAMSLSALWRSQGNMRGAHEALADVYGWFTEGFDTKDLQDAKQLLDQINEEMGGHAYVAQKDHVHSAQRGVS